MLSQFSVKRPYTVLVAVILIILLGFVSFQGMTTDLLPDIELPYILILTPYPGASPEEVELHATRPLESAVSTVGGLSQISSVSRENSSTIILEFIQGINMDTAVIELSNSLDMVSGQLEDGVGSPRLMRLNPDMMPVMVATTTVEGMDTAQVSTFAEETLVPAFLRTPGVANVTASGLLTSEIRITLDPDKIDDLNKTAFAQIDEKMDEAEAALKEARAELVSAKEKLKDETQTQQTRLSQAGAELVSAISNLESLLAEETWIESQALVLQQEKEALLPIQELHQLFSTYFPFGVGSLPEPLFDAMMERLADSLPAEIKGLSQEDMIALEEQAAHGMRRLGGIDSELRNLQIQKSILSSMRPQLEKGLSEAKTGFSQVEAGKMTLTMEMTRALVRIDSGLVEIEDGLTELENSRAQAHEEADLHSIIDQDLIGGLLGAQHFSMPAGYLENENGRNTLVKVGDRFDSEEDLKNAMLFSMEGIGDVYLKDIASVKITDDSAQTYARLDGQDSVMLMFQKQSTASTSEVTGRIHDTIASLSDEHEGLHVLPLMDQGEYINTTIDSVLTNLFLGGLLALAVLLLFLRDVRPTLVIAFSIPISLMFALTLMYFSGVTVNIISLSGLALGVGMLVDNSIVVIENIYRLRRDKVPVFRAAVFGARQVSGAIFASTLTTICVFLPIVFTHGLAREIFTDMGLTIAYSLLASLVVALTLVPTMASTALKKTTERRQIWFERLVDSYERLLTFSLRAKPLVLLCAALLFALSLFGASQVGTSFLPNMDSPQLSASLSPAEDSEEPDLFSLSDEFIDRVLDIEEVAHVGGSADLGGGMMDLGEGSTSFYILLHDDRARSNLEIEQAILDKTSDMEADIQVRASDMDMTALGGEGIEVLVKGDNLDDLYTSADEIATLASEIEGTRDIRAGEEDPEKEVRIIVDKEKAARQGLTTAQVYAEIAGALVTEERAFILSSGTEDYEVLILDPHRAGLEQENLSDFVMTASRLDGTEHEVLLEDIAQIKEADTPDAIRRDDQSRYVSVHIFIDPEYNVGHVSRVVNAALEDYTPMEGVSFEIEGEGEMIAGALQDVLLMAVLAIVFIYLIMVGQFQSLLSPFIILFTLPLAFTGGLMLPWVTGMAISLPAMMGFLVLAGIVVNNGIVFVDFVNQLRLDGRQKHEAIIEAGRLRIRPILMTALTTILAMSTMAFAYGQGAELTQPMAVVAIGGLAYGTLLTLLVVPVMYDLLNRRPLQKIKVSLDDDSDE